MSLALSLAQILTMGIWVFGPGRWSLTGLVLFFVVTVVNVHVNDESHEAIPLLEGGVGAAAVLLQLWAPGLLEFGGWTVPGGWGLVAIGVLVLTALVDQRLT